MFFKPEEFACTCGCGKREIDPDFLERLTVARRFADVPFIITSGVRCEEHNKAIGGVPSSSHITGHAVDIKCTTSSHRWSILNGLLMAGFRRIGIAKTFIHVDDDPTKDARVIWTY